MSFLDKVKDVGEKASKNIQQNYQDHKQKLADTRAVQGPRLGAVRAEYMGGYGAYKKAKGALTFYENQVEFNGGKAKFVVSNSQVSNVVVEGKDEVNRRVTVTRLLAVGIFAFALKKKSKDQEAYITVELNDGQEVIFFVEDKAPMKLRAELSNAISGVKKTTNGAVAVQAPGAVAQSSTADELTKLVELKNQGILTEEEFNRQKAKLLGS